MVLSAAHRTPPASVASPKNNHAEPGPSHPDSTGKAPWLTFDSLLSLAPSFLLEFPHCYTRMAHKWTVVGEKIIVSVLLPERSQIWHSS